MSGLFLGLLLLGVAPDLVPAERAYLEGRYDEAHALFLEALSTEDVPEAELLYNLGNCAYREGRFAEAVLHYRRARLRMPRDPKVRFNLGMAERELVLDVPRARSFAETVTAVLALLTRGELLLIVAALQTVGLLGFVLLRPGAPRKTMLMLVVLGVLGAIRLARLEWWPGPPEGIVLSRQISLRDEPDLERSPSSSLGLGETVRVIEVSGSWLRVDHAEATGWTERVGVGIVD